MVMNTLKWVAIYLPIAFGLHASFAISATVPKEVELASTQILIRNNGTEPQSLDPHKIVGVPEANLAIDLFEGLTIHDEKGDIIPGVATSWEHQNFTVWTFHLRKDAKWSNGAPVTAQDFVYSWRRVVDPNTASPYASYLQYAHIQNVGEVIRGEKQPEELGVIALDDYTLQVTLSAAVPYFPKIVGHATLLPVYQKNIEAHGDRWTQPANMISNGAYTLKSWVVNERIELTRNTEYWDNANTVIDEVTFLPITAENTSLNMYRSGGLDLGAGVPLEMFSKLKRDFGDEMIITPMLCTYYYEINNEQEPFTDSRVREALKLALDRDVIVNKVKNQGEVAAFGLTPPYVSGMDAKEPEWFSWSQKERNQRALQLLKDAGYSTKNPLTFTFLYNTSEGHKKIALAASSLWKQNLEGIVNVKLRNQEWKTFLDSRYQGKYQMASSGWCADYDEPSSFLNIMISDSSINSSRYRNANFDALLLKSIKTVDEQERALVYQQAETLLDHDSVIIPIYYYVNVRLIKPYVGGYSRKNPLGLMYTKDLYIKKH